jgi:hypothetical protein
MCPSWLRKRSAISHTCREDARRDVLRWRHRLLKFLDRHGRLYVTGKNWMQRHWTWIRAQRFELAPL